MLYSTYSRGLSSTCVQFLLKKNFKPTRSVPRLYYFQAIVLTRRP